MKKYILFALATGLLMCGQMPEAEANNARPLWFSSKTFNQMRLGAYRMFSVRLTSWKGCKLRVSFFLHAALRPQKKVYHRFRARLSLVKGQQKFTALPRLKTFTFGPMVNKNGGARTISYVLDTRGKGCWSKKYHRPYGLKLRHCKGKGCSIPSF